MRKALHVGIVMSVLATLAIAGLVGQAGAAGEIIVCHATGSQTNDFNIFVTDESGANGHAKHESDIIAFDPSQEQIDQAKFLTDPENEVTSEDIADFCLSLQEEPPTTPSAPAAPAQPGAPAVTG